MFIWEVDGRHLLIASPGGSWCELMLGWILLPTENSQYIIITSVTTHLFSAVDIGNSSFLPFKQQLSLHMSLPQMPNHCNTLVDSMVTLWLLYLTPNSSAHNKFCSFYWVLYFLLLSPDLYDLRCLMICFYFVLFPRISPLEGVIPIISWEKIMS